MAHNVGVLNHSHVFEQPNYVEQLKSEVEMEAINVVQIHLVNLTTSTYKAQVVIT
jgi:hypothetical protein